MQLWSEPHKKRLRKAGFSARDIRLAETLSTHRVLLCYDSQNLCSVLEAICGEQEVPVEHFYAVAGSFFPTRQEILDEAFFNAYRQCHGDLLQLIAQLRPTAGKRLIKNSENTATEAAPRPISQAL